MVLLSTSWRGILYLLFRHGLAYPLTELGDLVRKNLRVLIKLRFSYKGKKVVLPVWQLDVK